MPFVPLEADGIDTTQQDFSPIPEGKYLAVCKSTEERMTRNNDPMVKLTWEITEGQFKGRLIWDQIVFAGGGLKRTKLVCESLGAPIKGGEDYDPAQLVGRVAYLETKPEEFPVGSGKINAKVEYNGYSLASLTAAVADDDIPF